MKGACGASPKPRVPGVPTAVSAGGAGGLPERPREGRGRGVVSGVDLGLRAMRDIWRDGRHRSSEVGDYEGGASGGMFISLRGAWGNMAEPMPRLMAGG